MMMIIIIIIGYVSNWMFWVGNLIIGILYYIADVCIFSVKTLVTVTLH